MSHFYGTLQGNRGQATRCGSKASGIETVAASWQGCVRVRVWYDADSGQDRFSVEQDRWHSAGIRQPIQEGIIGERNMRLAVQGGRLEAAG